MGVLLSVLHKGKGGCEGVCRDQEASVTSSHCSVCYNFLSFLSKQQQNLQFIVVLNLLCGHKWQGRY